MSPRSSPGLSSYVATLILVVISLSLSYVVYEGVRSFDPGKQQEDATFTNQLLLLPGSPQDILLVTVNASQQETPAALEAGSAISSQGLLYLTTSGSYGTLSASLCTAGATTFFSVFSATPGILQVQSNGESWIDGRWANSLAVASGWNEVMISNASSCLVVMPDGVTASGLEEQVSPVPIIGTLTSNTFRFYLPTEGSGPGSLLLVFDDGGYDSVA